MTIDTVLDKMNWINRRRYLYAVTSFVMLIMIAAAAGLVKEKDVATAIITNGFWVLAAFTGTYVFGAVWDHTNQRKFAVTENTTVPPATKET